MFPSNNYDNINNRDNILLKVITTLPRYEIVLLNNPILQMDIFYSAKVFHILRNHNHVINNSGDTNP